MLCEFLGHYFTIHSSIISNQGDNPDVVFTEVSMIFLKRNCFSESNIVKRVCFSYVAQNP